MDKWNTEKGQDRKRPRQKELKDQVEEQERKRRTSGIQKKAKTERAKDQVEEQVRKRRWKSGIQKKTKTERARPRWAEKKERRWKSGIQCHDNPEIKEKGEDITHPQQTDRNRPTDRQTDRGTTSTTKTLQKTKQKMSSNPNWITLCTLRAGIGCY